jgi:hypothetical protein
MHEAAAANLERGSNDCKLRNESLKLKIESLSASVALMVSISNTNVYLHKSGRSHNIKMLEIASQPSDLHIRRPVCNV